MQIINNIKYYDITDSILITPIMASELLSKHNCIKKIDNEQLKKIEKDLIDDNFKFNGATIALDADGNLIDGRHRLTACVNTGIAFNTLLVWGVDTNGQYTKDTGRSRSIVQVIANKGYKNPMALYQCSLILNGILTSDDNTEEIKDVYLNDVTNKDIINILDTTPNLDVSVNMIIKNKKNYPISAIHHLIVLDYLCRFVDNKPDMATEFLDVLSNIKSAEFTHPAMMLKNTLFNTKFSKKKQIALLIKAYNLFKQNLRCTKLGWTESSKIPSVYMLSETA